MLSDIYFKKFPEIDFIETNKKYDIIEEELNSKLKRIKTNIHLTIDY